MKKTFIALAVLLSACKGNNKKENTPITDKLSDDVKMKKEIYLHPDSLLLKENLLEFYRKNGDYNNAIKQAEEYLQNDSGNQRLWHIKGILYYENEDTSAAAYCFTRALTIEPNPNDLLYLATLKAHQKDTISLSLAEDLKKAYNDFQKQALFVKGVYFSEIRNYQQAIKFYDSCLSISYTFMEAYREKAICLSQMKKYKEAVQVLTKAVTVQNSYDEGHYYLGQCYEKMNMKAEAVKSYETALMYSPDYSEAKDALKKLNE